MLRNWKKAFLEKGRIILLYGGVCGLDDIIVLPEHRHKGYGFELLEYCKQKAKELGSNKTRLGMINDNKKLRTWY